MNTNEKILLVQLLLEDIEYDYDSNAEGRALKAKSLCEEIVSETRNDEFAILADFCDTYINSGKKWGDWDGRLFRQSFPMGYNNMDKLHKLKHTIKNKSDDFKFVTKEYMAFPEFRFNDWESFLEGSDS